MTVFGSYIFHHASVKQFSLISSIDDSSHGGTLRGVVDTCTPGKTRQGKCAPNAVRCKCVAVGGLTPKVVAPRRPPQLKTSERIYASLFRSCLGLRTFISPKWSVAVCPPGGCSANAAQTVKHFVLAKQYLQAQTSTIHLHHSRAEPLANTPKVPSIVKVRKKRGQDSREKPRPC
jgi:hypothetical protein